MIFPFCVLAAFATVGNYRRYPVFKVPVFRHLIRYQSFRLGNLKTFVSISFSHILFSRYAPVGGTPCRLAVVPCRLAWLQYAPVAFAWSRMFFKTTKPQVRSYVNYDGLVKPQVEWGVLCCPVIDQAQRITICERRHMHARIGDILLRIRICRYKALE